MTRAYGKGAKARATELHSLIVRDRDGWRCQRCGTRPATRRGLHCAHIVSRTYSNTRTAEDNALALCARCHRWFTNHPIEFGRFCDERFGRDAMDALRLRAESRAKVDWDAEAARLLGVARELGLR